MTISIEFLSRVKQHSEYDWADISFCGTRVGKARCLLKKSTVIICSINIYPEWEGRGYGKEFVNYCQNHFEIIIADRVRNSARGFWEALGFSDHGDGSWIYRNSGKTKRA